MVAPAGALVCIVVHPRVIGRPPVIIQVDLLHGVIEPFLRGETPKGMFGEPGDPEAP
jgi:hypothetical protein